MSVIPVPGLSYKASPTTNLVCCPGAGSRVLILNVKGGVEGKKSGCFSCFSLNSEEKADTWRAVHRLIVSVYGEEHTNAAFKEVAPNIDLKRTRLPILRGDVVDDIHVAAQKSNEEDLSTAMVQYHSYKATEVEAAPTNALLGIINYAAKALGLSQEAPAVGVAGPADRRVEMQTKVDVTFYARFSRTIKTVSIPDRGSVDPATIQRIVVQLTAQLEAEGHFVDSVKIAKVVSIEIKREQLFRWLDHHEGIRSVADTERLPAEDMRFLLAQSRQLAHRV